MNHFSHARLSSGKLRKRLSRRRFLGILAGSAILGVGCGLLCSGGRHQLPRIQTRPLKTADLYASHKLAG